MIGGPIGTHLLPKLQCPRRTPLACNPRSLDIQPLSPRAPERKVRYLITSNIWKSRFQSRDRQARSTKVPLYPSKRLSVPLSARGRIGRPHIDLVTEKGRSSRQNPACKGCLRRQAGTRRIRTISTCRHRKLPLSSAANNSRLQRIAIQSSPSLGPGIPVYRERRLLAGIRKKTGQARLSAFPLSPTPVAFSVGLLGSDLCHRRKDTLLAHLTSIVTSPWTALEALLATAHPAQP